MAHMSKQRRIKYVHEAGYVAEVDVELLQTSDELAPYLSLEDAYKLDDVRDALKCGDLEAASQTGARLFDATRCDLRVKDGDKNFP